METNYFDIAIVGAGISGIYTAWRLATARQSDLAGIIDWAGIQERPRVGVFEQSDRIGGRMLSAQTPHAPEAICELGGMRYMSSQKLIRGLVENKLRLGTRPQDVDFPENLAFLRGKPLREADTLIASRVPYYLSWDERQPLAKTGPVSLITHAAEKILPRVSKLNGEKLHTYLQNERFDGTPLYEHGFWNLLARTMSTEAYQLARTMSGYDGLGSNANAVDLMLAFFDFAPDVKYNLVNEGYDVIPWKLHKDFLAAGGEVRKQHQLESFDRRELDDGRTGVVLRFENDCEITARAVVLAMPRRAIQLLAQTGPVLDRSNLQAQKLLSSVKAIPLYKLFVVYEYPWWQSVGVTKGRSLTDLPLHQCYYWPVRASGEIRDTDTGIIMAYNDQTGVEFWGGLRDTGRYSMRTFSSEEIPPSVPSDHEQYLRNNWQTQKAPTAMVQEMHRQLMAMHGMDYAPDPIDAAFMDWSQDPYGGGVHFWNIGEKSWERVHEVVKPVEDFPCFICGEAWSTNQTWVEGALETAELVLQDHFKLPAPDWI